MYPRIQKADLSEYQIWFLQSGTVQPETNFENRRFFEKKGQKIEFITVNYPRYLDLIWLKFGLMLQIKSVYLVLKFKVDIFRVSYILFKKTPKK